MNTKALDTILLILVNCRCSKLGTGGILPLQLSFLPVLGI